MTPRPVAQVRPRFGTLRRPNGAEVLLQFVPVDEGRCTCPLGTHPSTFQPVDAADGETPVRVGLADTLTVDVLGPGQSIVLERLR